MGFDAKNGNNGNNGWCSEHTKHMVALIGAYTLIMDFHGLKRGLKLRLIIFFG